MLVNSTIACMTHAHSEPPRHALDYTSYSQAQATSLPTITTTAQTTSSLTAITRPPRPAVNLRVAYYYHYYQHGIAVQTLFFFANFPPTR